MLANWLERYRAAQPAHHVHAYFLGAGSDATNPFHLVRHLIEHIRRMTSSQNEIADAPQALLDSLPAWLAQASAYAARHDTQWLIALDGLNNLADLCDLRWFPSFLPDRIHVVVSCLPGDVQTVLRSKGHWHEVAVAALTDASSRELLRAYLAIYNKTLPDDLEDRVIEHPLSRIPLFLRTLTEELRLFGNHEALSQQLDLYLASATIDDLFERVLARIEADCGAQAVRKAMVALWASRAGLTEQELLAYLGLPRTTWAVIRYGLGTALLESGDRIAFGHDYMRIAVSDRYLAGNGALADEGQTPLALRRRAKAHADLAKWFEARAFTTDGGDGISISDARTIEEIPYQWQAARRWEKLKAFLTRHDAFKAFGEHSDEYELLGYWLQVEAHCKVRLENAYRLAWSRWKRHLNKETKGHCSTAIVRFLDVAGRFSGGFAVRMAQEALTIVEHALGPNHPDAGARLHDLAALLHAKGNLAQAEPLYLRALIIAEQTQGPQHPDTGARLNDLALLLQDKGDLSQAESLFRQSLEISEQVFGKEHQFTGIRLSNLARLLQLLGDFHSAEEFFRRALDVATRALGSHHPSVGIAKNNLAGVLHDNGEFVDAEQLYRDALATVEKTLGPHHPTTGRLLENLAVLLRDKGQLAEAEPLNIRALEISERAEGPEHPSTAQRLNNLAMVLADKGDIAAAEPLVRRALTIAEKALGPDHPSTETSLNNLARLLEAKGCLLYTS
uniref:tetratricopeptide repeat protein n=1 Tax=Pantanalinema rosaneae TaxID=1620701 RepID=UPI003D6EFC4B